jgi:hypothetical protein
MERISVEPTDLSRADLSRATLEEVNFKNVKNLTLEQLIKVKTLYQCKNLDSKLLEEIQQSHPELLEESKDKEQLVW